MNRFSMNGDGKKRVPNDRISSTDGHTPNNPNDEREQHVIKALKERYDEIEALWNDAEEDLKRFRVPHAVPCHYDSNHEGNCPIYYSLWWMKYGKGWRIVHEERYAYSEFDDKREDECEWKPIIECPVALRTSMIAMFASLRPARTATARHAAPRWYR